MTGTKGNTGLADGTWKKPFDGASDEALQAPRTASSSRYTPDDRRSMDADPKRAEAKMAFNSGDIFRLPMG
jgi:hypothetical protein